MSEALYFVIGLAVVAAIALVAFAAWRQGTRRVRGEHLRERFGPEYERMLSEHGDARAAERELRAREKRARAFVLRDLSRVEYQRYYLKWADVQRRFVDEPAKAVTEAHELCKDLMAARGYPVESFEQRVRDLSVDHAHVIEHYRAAHALHHQNRQDGQWATEELRQAMVHYRALFEELLTPAPESAPQPSFGRPMVRSVP